jgi:lipopolysaccharide transport system permease protein
MLFYLTPILYSVDLIPAVLRPIVLINPLVPLIQAFRDVIVYARAPDLISLYYPLVFGVAVLYLGYIFFKANEKRFTDFL